MLHILLYFFALLSLSTSPNWAKLNQMPADVLGFWRLSIAAALLITFVYLTKKDRLLTFTKNSRWILASGFFFFLHLWTYKYAAKHTLVSNTMIIFATNPIWASVGSLLLFKEKITKRMVIAYVLAFFGIAMLVNGQFQLSNSENTGNWSAFVSAIFYAVYILTGKKSRQYFSNWIYSSHIYVIAAVCFLISTLITGSEITADYDTNSWIAVIGLVALPTFLGHFSFSYLVKFMNISVMTCGKLLEPVLASLIAFVVFNETLSPMAGVAFACTTAAVLILFWPKQMIDKIKSRAKLF